ncbi:MAG: hypothetical protein K1X83_09280 [Oligoflexia bacterium]|nr:hypothetical protein [Oligoflexia bacterium]
MLSDIQRDFLLNVARLADESRTSVLIVGGLIRDALLGQALQDRDLDLVVEGNALPFARLCAQEMGARLTEFERFGTAKLTGPKNFPGIVEVDIASTRTETYTRPGALPEVLLVDSIRADLQRRDFTINCLAIRLPAFVESMREHNRQLLEESSLDFFGGLNDLRSGTIRVLHARSFKDDPTRLYRACRYAARLGARFDPLTQELFDSARTARDYESISIQRRVNEFRRNFEEPHPAAALTALCSSGLAESLPAAQPGRLTAELELLARFLTKLRAEQSYEVFLTLFFANWPEPELPALGFKRDKLKQLRHDADLLNNLPPSLSGLSPQLLMAALCNRSTRERWSEIRSILIAQGWLE